MPIIEVLENRGTPGQVWPAATFIVNNAAPTGSVPWTKNVDPESGRVVSASGAIVNEWWDAGDNFNLLSIGVLIPGLFVEVGTEGGSSAIDVQLIGRDNDANEFVFYDGFIPWGQYELAIGQYFDVTAAGFTSKWQMYLKIETQNSISMYGVPDAENTKEYAVNTFVKVQHNTALTPNP